VTKVVKRRVKSESVIPARPSEPINPTALYTYQEAAAHLRMSKRAVSKLVHNGRLGHTELNGKQWRVMGRQLLDFAERNAKGPLR
jgi:excisionase family DNA binding protein